MATVFWESEGVVLADFLKVKKCYRCLLGLRRRFKEIESKIS